MNETERMLIEHACQRLAVSYANCIDAYDYDGFMELFADDAVLVMLGKQWSGRTAIRKFLDGRPKAMIVRHLVTNHVVDVVDESHATGSCYTISYRVMDGLGDEPGPLVRPNYLVGYRDRHVRDPGRGWLFARRDVTAALAGPEEAKAIRTSRQAVAELEQRQ